MTNEIIDSFFAHPVSDPRVRKTKTSSENTATGLLIPKSTQRSITLKPRKNSRVAAALPHETHSTSVLKFDRAPVNRVNLIPRNTAQETYISQLLNDNMRIVFAVGPAGTR